MTMKTFVAVLVALGAGSLAKAQTQDDYATMARTTWAAFECSMYAKDDKETDRLFVVGYQAGTTFLQAAKAGKVAKGTWQRVPVGISWNLTGPTNDFMLGVIYQSALDEGIRKLQQGTG